MPPSLTSTTSVSSSGLSWEAFQANADCQYWTLAGDAKIIQSINVACAASGLSPWNVSPAKVMDIFRPRSESELEKIVCRVALLKMFNHDVSRMIAFFDLSWWYFAPSHCIYNATLFVRTRPSLFMALKHAALERILDKTLTHPKKAEDDYDYPEDLPQLMVNRPKAAVAHLKSDFDTVVSQSLFGQAFDELHFLENKVLRMVKEALSYIHVKKCTFYA
jgi:hypothetical protein